MTVRERQRETETLRETDRERQRQRTAQLIVRERDRQRQTETLRDRDRQTNRERQTDRERQREKRGYPDIPYMTSTILTITIYSFIRPSAMVYVFYPTLQNQAKLIQCESPVAHTHTHTHTHTVRHRMYVCMYVCMYVSVYVCTYKHRRLTINESLHTNAFFFSFNGVNLADGISVCFQTGF